MTYKNGDKYFGEWENGRKVVDKNRCFHHIKVNF